MNPENEKFKEEGAPAAPPLELDNESLAKKNGQYWENIKAAGITDAGIEEFKQGWRKSIERASQSGSLDIGIGRRGITEKDKQKLAAFSELAEEMGYEIGPFVLDDKKHSVSAPVIKPDSDQQQKRAA